MNLIAAVDNNYGIGYRGNLLFRIPEDLRHVRALTLHKVIIMGRETFLTLPKGALPDRLNIVLSTQADFRPEGVTVCGGLLELWQATAGYSTDDLFVFGGQQVYELLLEHCHYAYLTHIDAQRPADTFFPDLRALPHWTEISRSPEQEHQGLKYYWSVYENQHMK